MIERVLRRLDFSCDLVKFVEVTKIAGDKNNPDLFDGVVFQIRVDESIADNLKRQPVFTAFWKP